MRVLGDKLRKDLGMVSRWYCFVLFFFLFAPCTVVLVRYLGIVEGGRGKKKKKGDPGWV